MSSKLKYASTEETGWSSTTSCIIIKYFDDICQLRLNQADGQTCVALSALRILKRIGDIIGVNERFFGSGRNVYCDVWIHQPSRGFVASGFSRLPPSILLPARQTSGILLSVISAHNAWQVIPEVNFFRAQLSRKPVSSSDRKSILLITSK
jgi:hypothetical protein